MKKGKELKTRRGIGYVLRKYHNYYLMLLPGLIFVILFLDHSADALPGLGKAGLFYDGKRKEDHRVSTLQLAVGFPLPDGQPLEYVVLFGTLYGEEAFQHADVQGLAKAAGAGD